MATKKFAEKAKNIHFQLPSIETAPADAATSAVDAPPPRTAVGTHLQAVYRDRDLAAEAEGLRGQVTELAAEAEDLRARERDLAQEAENLRARDRELAQVAKSLRGRLSDYDGSLPTKRLDPAAVVLSRFANRHPDSFRDAEFAALRAEIEAAGGNTQPIGVRPLPGSPGTYELSFGSRRRQACLELGLPVLALIEEMDEATLFERMERENRQRKNLRPYEQGMLYRRALEEKLFPSGRKLAEHLQIDSTGLSRLLAVANLPTAILEAFESPLDIQFDWGAALNEALQSNPDAVIAKATELKAISPRAAKLVLQQLLSAATVGKGPNKKQATVEVHGAAGQVATVAFGKKTTAIKITGLPLSKHAALEAALRKLLT